MKSQNPHAGAARRFQAKARQCPKCGRKDALVRQLDGGVACRWGAQDKCDYYRPDPRTVA